MLLSKLLCLLQRVAPNMIEIRNITKVFGAGEHAVTALQEINVNIAENEFFTLLGPSGCGKTTLLRLIAGFEHPSTGSMLLAGEDISLLPPNKRPVNTVFQNYALFPHMTVAGNIAFGLEMLGRPKAEVAETVDRMLRLVRMEELKNRQTSEISGGQQQRVALARALAPQPKVLLLDEPLSALDLKLRKEMQIELKRLQSETGITFVFVTHDQEEALTMSDRIAVMNAGRIHQIGSPRQIYDHPENRFVANFIGDSNFLNAKLGNIKDDQAELEFAAGRKVTVPLHRADLSDGEVSVLIRPEHVSIAEPTGNSHELTGVIENIVYFGTDTHYHLKLASGEAFMARLQNNPSEAEKRAAGDKVAVLMDAKAIQILRD
jgi:spermidine/putrescine transport system ATP-binding protein